MLSSNLDIFYSTNMTVECTNLPLSKDYDCFAPVKKDHYVIFAICKNILNN